MVERFHRRDDLNTEDAAPEDDALLVARRRTSDWRASAHDPARRTPRCLISTVHYLGYADCRASLRGGPNASVASSAPSIDRTGRPSSP